MDVEATTDDASDGVEKTRYDKLLQCDLVMKGGVTSGVVYPPAIVALSKKYRFRGIAGSSAGSIAAVLTAAAEYRRAKEGHACSLENLNTITVAVQNTTKQMFQPSKPFERVFVAIFGSLNEQSGSIPAPRIMWRLLWVFRPQLLVGFALFVLCAVTAWTVDASLGVRMLGVVTAAAAGGLLAASLAFRRMRKLIKTTLPSREHDFGICSGLSVSEEAKEPALTEWMHRSIQELAGRKAEPDDASGTPEQAERHAAPLTIGDLAGRETLPEPRIVLKAMTTDLSSGRPYQLPLTEPGHYFSKAEFLRLFPPHFVDHLCGVSTPYVKNGDKDEGAPCDLYALPVGRDFPVLLVARLSLSFPILISAVPLWRRDRTCGDAMRRCLFSDGGISSNFPIHFFDELLPRWPTFGITLGELNVDRFPPEEPEASDKRAAAAPDGPASADDCKHVGGRVMLPSEGRDERDLPIKQIKTVFDFTSSIFFTAKDWNDKLQALLPGYAERIVTVLLDKNQGGLNLGMPGPVVKDIRDLGGEAGRRLVEDFDFDEHRYMRAVAALPVLEGALDKLADAYVKETPEPQYPDILETYVTKRRAYANDPTWRRQALHALAADLNRLGARAQALAKSGQGVRDGRAPLGGAAMRVVADASQSAPPERTGPASPHKPNEPLVG